MPQLVADSDAELSAGDVFDVRVYGEEELGGTYRVADDGSIDFPFVGSVKVAGLQPPELARSIRRKLKGGGYFRDPQVSVLLKESNSKRVSVVGAVQKPGTFPLTPGLTMVQAVSLAGGFTSIADRKNAIVTRRSGTSPERFRVSIEDVARGRSEDPPLVGGDIVFVPDRLF